MKKFVIAAVIVVLIIAIGIIVLKNESEDKQEKVTWCTPGPSSVSVYGNMLDTIGAEKHLIYGETIETCCYEGLIQHQEKEWVQNQDKAMIQFGKLCGDEVQCKMKYCLSVATTEERQAGWVYNKGQWLKYKEGRATKNGNLEACTKIFDREENVIEEFCYQP